MAHSRPTDAPRACDVTRQRAGRCSLHAAAKRRACGNRTQVRRDKHSPYGATVRLGRSRKCKGIRHARAGTTASGRLLVTQHTARTTICISDACVFFVFLHEQACISQPGLWVRGHVIRPRPFAFGLTYFLSGLLCKKPLRLPIAAARLFRCGCCRLGCFSECRTRDIADADRG